MNTWDTHQDYPVQPSDRQALGLRYVRRRRLLGILLITAGCVWLWLRMIGWVGDLLVSAGWVSETLAMLEPVMSGDLALSMPQAACGMLATYTIRRTQ